jgi:hypothetical protein
VSYEAAKAHWSGLDVQRRFALRPGFEEIRIFDLQGDAQRRSHSLPVQSIERWFDLRRWISVPHKTIVTIDFMANERITLLS